MPRQFTTDAEAQDYLRPKFDQLTAALEHHDAAAVATILRTIIDDGYPAAADVVLDGLVAFAMHRLTGPATDQCAAPDPMVDEPTHPATNPAPRPPRQDLILDVLAARYRTGEPFWNVDDRFARPVAALEEDGLVERMGDEGNHRTRLRLTAAGRDRILGSGYVSPLEQARKAAARDRDRYGALLLGVTAAWAELERRNRDHAGHGRDGHLDSGDLDLLRNVVLGTSQ